MLAVRLTELAKGSDEEALVEASMRLDALPVELLRAELRLARADRQAARATLQAAEASLARAVANVRDVQPLPDATVKEKLERAAEDDSEEPEGEQADEAPVESPGLADAAKARRGADEQWGGSAAAVERAGSGSGRGRPPWRGGPPRAGRAGPPAFAKRATDARGASSRPGPPTARTSWSLHATSWPSGPRRAAGARAGPIGGP